MYDTEMNTIFINSENSKISDPHKLSLNLTKKKKKNWDKKINALLYLIFIFILYGKLSKGHIKIIDFKKCEFRNKMKDLNYLMDYILYQIFKNILNIY